MADSIWMPLYIGDYLADTQLLSVEQHGAYLLLIMAYWRNSGALPNNDEILSTVCKVSPQKWKKIKPVIFSFFEVGKETIFHKRLEEEIAKSKSRSSRGKKASQKRWEKGENDDA